MPETVAADLTRFSTPSARRWNANLTAGPNAAEAETGRWHRAPEFEAYVSLAGLIDPAAEAKRLEKQIADAKKQLAGIVAKLANEKFVSSAPPEVVAETRAKAAELEKQIAAMEENLKDLLDGG